MQNSGFGNSLFATRFGLPNPSFLVAMMQWSLFTGGDDVAGEGNTLMHNDGLDAERNRDDRRKESKQLCTASQRCLFWDEIDRSK